MIKQAIQKAIEFGWVGVNPFEINVNPHDEDLPKAMVEVMQSIMRKPYISEVLLDKNFWQALGKSEGWEWFADIADYNVFMANRPEGKTHWKIEMRNFIDHLIQGKDIDSYFKELLK
jgi:hypothetical protein